MQYIQKQNIEPDNWNQLFIVPPSRRTYDFKSDYSALQELKEVKSILIEEQHGLCAYCQQRITVDDASIEHVTPKEHNKELSTNYFNLVAVCKKSQVKDTETGMYHCDSSRGSKLIPPIIFYANAKSTESAVNKYFMASSSGEVLPKQNLDSSTRKQVESFIDILNLNHSSLKYKRAKDTLEGIISACRAVDKKDRRRFLAAQYNRIFNNPAQPFREYLLLVIGAKLGLS